MVTIEELIGRKDYDGLRECLRSDPRLANRNIPLETGNSQLAHPLHRLCDLVYSGICTEDQALSMAKIFLENGALVDGIDKQPYQDSPLIAAASLQADQLAVLYLEHGADIQHPGTHGGTALHWAAWCGRDALVEKLLEAGAGTNSTCRSFKATPLFWNIHGWKHQGNQQNRASYLACMEFLLKAGADQNTPNAEGYFILNLLDDSDEDFLRLIR